MLSRKKNRGKTFELLCTLHYSPKYKVAFGIFIRATMGSLSFLVLAAALHQLTLL